jgi:hypothetical protein
MEVAHPGEEYLANLLSAENYEAAYQAQPCDALQDPTWNMRAGRQHNFEQSEAVHAISPVLSLSTV